MKVKQKKATSYYMTAVIGQLQNHKHSACQKQN